MENSIRGARARKRKYSGKVKKFISNLEESLNSLGAKPRRVPRNHGQVVADSMSFIRNLEDDLSQVLADIRTDCSGTINNASRFTLSSVNAAFSRHLREAEDKAKEYDMTDEELKEVYERHMEKAAMTYFSDLFMDALPPPMMEEEVEEPTDLLSGAGAGGGHETDLLASPSPSASTRNGVGNLVTSGSSCRSESDLITPLQHNKGKNVCIVTPKFSKPKKQRGDSTPVSTPGSTHCDTTPVDARKPRLSFCKKSLTFADDLWPTNNINNGSPVKKFKGTFSTKKRQVCSNFDSEISQDLLPLPTHCSRQLSMTPLSALKTPTKIHCANGAEEPGRHELLFSQGLEGVTSKFASQMALASSSESGSDGSQDLYSDIRNSVEKDNHGLHYLDFRDQCSRGTSLEDNLPRERTPSHTSQDEELCSSLETRAGSQHSQKHRQQSEMENNSGQKNFLIGQNGIFSCMNKTSVPTSFTKECQRGSRSPRSATHIIRTHESTTDNLFDTRFSNSKARDPQSPARMEPHYMSSQMLAPLDRVRSWVTKSPIHGCLNVSTDSLSTSEDSPCARGSPCLSPIPRSPEYQAMVKAGKFIDTSYPVTPKGNLIHSSPRALEKLTPPLPGPSGYQFATPKGKRFRMTSPAQGSSDVTPKQKHYPLSPVPGPSGFHAALSRRHFMQKSPMWGPPRFEPSTPEATYRQLQAQAPRKTGFYVPLKRTPSCKRSLSRQFAEISKTNNPFITPPQSPARLMKPYYVPGLESDSDE